MKRAVLLVALRARAAGARLSRHHPRRAHRARRARLVAAPAPGRNASLARSGSTSRSTLDGGEREPARRELMRRWRSSIPKAASRPTVGGSSALGWLVAGAAVEGVPAERTRNHFYDPTRGDRPRRGRRRSAAHAPRRRRDAASARCAASSPAPTSTARAWPRPTGCARRDNEWGLAALPRRARAQRRGADERPSATARWRARCSPPARSRTSSRTPAIRRWCATTIASRSRPTAAPTSASSAAEYGRVGVPELDGAPVAKPHLTRSSTTATAAAWPIARSRASSRPARCPTAAATRARRRRRAPPAPATPAAPCAHLAHYERTPRGLALVARRALLRRLRARAPARDRALRRRRARAALPRPPRRRRRARIGDGDRTRRRARPRQGQHLRRRRRRRAPPGARARRRSAPPTATPSSTSTLPAGTRRVAAVFRGVDAAGEPLVVVQEQTIK